ncbi:MAG: Holliday junction branch migration protein RuvA [Erysipelotrichaceae bacterium]|nr:Holliday junction branch migration protein RuvA [Erysipelotrichaceae bacterium]
MIRFIRGTVYSFGIDYVIIDCNGVGYYINFMHQDQITLGQNITVFTYQQFREDAQLLYGFLDQKELDLFEKLISVKGLGPKTAMTMLGHRNYNDLVNAIENGEIDFLTKIPSLGAKTSKQIILDLKGKLVVEDNSNSGKNNEKLDEAVLGLKALGYKTYEINGVLPELRKMNDLSVDEYLKEGLKLLLQRKGG